jgi:MazG family protein
MSSLDRLLQIMARLRDPENGCPWDLKQTYRTIVPYTLEEAYEVADAIEHGDLQQLREELGDLLFQVVFYCQIAREQGAFDFDQVAAGIADKMLRRHPHVFGDADFEDEHSLRLAWEEAKAEERSGKAQADPSRLAGVARALPALLRAHKLQRRAADVGFDWPDPRGALEKTGEEIAEVAHAAQTQDREHLEEELGDLLFALVNVVRLYGFQAEHALRRANDKFERRFRRMESLLGEAGAGDLSGLSLDRLEEAWERVKREERSS